MYFTTFIVVGNNMISIDRVEMNSKFKAQTSRSQGRNTGENVKKVPQINI